MSDIIPATSIDDIIDAPVGVKRLIAEALRQQGLREVYYTPDGQKHTYIDTIALMIWDAATEGEIKFADGTVLTVNDDAKAWTDVVKFLTNFLDGPVGTSNNIGQVNVFKVYQGIDPDKV
jgi:hypothetical protein